ncbi:MAG: flagellar filament capping protein FliD [Limnochordaceae bacterium]|nr:flagellar filament capping protein FliD [Limnochordaceae bacterium]
MLQIGGLASGLDTQNLIDQLMQVEAQPLNLWKKQQEQLQEKATAWKDIQGRLSSLQSRVNDLTDLTLFRARIASSTNEQVVSAAASTGATAVTLDVVVDRLATVHRLAGLHASDPTAALNQTGTVTVTVGGVSKSLDITATDSLTAVRDKLNGLGLNLRAALVNQTLVIEGTQTGSSQRITVSDNSGGQLLQALGLRKDLTRVAGVTTASWRSATSLSSQTEAAAVLDSNPTTYWEGNPNDRLDVRLGGSRYVDQLTFDTASSGASFTYHVEYLPAGAQANDPAAWVKTATATAVAGSQTITVDLGGQLVQEVRVVIDSGTAQVSELAVHGEETLQAPGDAQVRVNGLTVTASTNQLTGISDGLTLNLSGLGQAQVSVKTNVDQIVSRVKAFVDQYNSTFGLMQDKSGKQAVLQGDISLMQLMTNLRFKTTGPAEGVLPAGQASTLAQIGVQIDRSGVMSLDETKLRQMLADNPDQVRLLLQANAGTDGFTGVAQRLSDFLQRTLDPVSGLTVTSQNAIQSRVDDLDKQMEAFQKRLDQRREELVRQFTALEQVINTLQSQSNWLAGQLKQLGGGTAK